MALPPDYPKETLTIGAIYNASKGTMALITNHPKQLTMALGPNYSKEHWHLSP